MWPNMPLINNGPLAVGYKDVGVEIKAALAHAEVLRFGKKEEKEIMTRLCCHAKIRMEKLISGSVC